MNYSIKILLLVGLASLSIQAYSDAITDTYATGDTLTADTLNNIKSAVNDNDSNITTNTTNIGTNATNISTNAADISTNSTNINTNTTDIGINAAGISTNAGNISGNSARIDSNSISISTNASSLTTLSSTLSQSEISLGAIERIQNISFSGDGSGGDLSINSDISYEINPPISLFFENIYIGPSATFTVPSGTTFYCSGSFTNDGTIVVLPRSSTGGRMLYSRESLTFGPFYMSFNHPPSTGDTSEAAENGRFEVGSVGSVGGGHGVC